jgi:hypothetical protein
VFETFSTVYLPDAAARQLAEALETAGGDDRPLAWVSVRRWELGAGRTRRSSSSCACGPEPRGSSPTSTRTGTTLDWRL